MLSPMMTVVVLAVLWLIVIVPMVLRRNDERRRERSVAGFGKAMRALGRRSKIGALAPGLPSGSSGEPRSEVFVAHAARPSDAPSPARRPVPAVQEALMYPVDRTELSEARADMMARRRRSLSVLIGGTVLFLLLAVIMGGLLWVPALGFTAGLAGYFFFLRTQALHDRERRTSRQERAAARSPHGYNASTDFARFEEFPESVVRIDDDDLNLHNLDTIDLTGLYVDDTERADTDLPAQRRAS